ncbi:AAA family ATPase [Clostridium sp. Ade.TY]|uniref:ATP-binding protein n=1 Tax=Clostridium sp. Ade.TY TaxID=1391647 RepID=UPI00040750E2|nr:AAA family ATPase [Clostridium sp. Ade.TY]
MIIKKIRIKSFAGIKDREINFNSGLNLVYGENEKGKSTIQNFIKIWLYGFGNTRGGKNNLRKKYMPFSGERMQGELVVFYDNKDYIIKRTFGLTKKDDICTIYDGLTGEEVKNINKDEPGVYFLGVNSNTFLKTLFIPQLGVMVSRDKDEQMMQKIIDIFGCGEGEVSAYTAIEKLKNSRKELTTTRKNGELDILKERYNKVIEERYEAYKLSESNLINENELINKKEERKNLREEIEKLELFKKYLKKSNLQKEYGEITNYLKKSEDLKRREKEIETELKRNNGVIDEKYIDELSEENKKYLTFLDIKKENEYELKEVENRINDENEKIKRYDVFSSMEDGLKEKLIKLNAEQEGLRERALLNKKLKLSIEEEEEKINKKKKFLGDSLKLTSHKEKIKNLFKEYEEKLHKVKEIIENSNQYDEKTLMEKSKLENKRKLGAILSTISGLLIGINIASINNPFLYLIFIILIVLGIYMILIANNSLNNVNSSLESKKNVDNLNSEIKNIEDQLDEYVKLSKCNNYKNLLMAINTLENFYVSESQSKLRIEERKSQLDNLSFEKDEERYKQNEKILSSIMKLCDCNNLDDIYIELDEYTSIKNKIKLLNMEYNSKKENLERISFELEDKEKEIKEKLTIMDLEHIQLVDLEMYLKEFRDKISKKKELENSLKSVDETYKVLLKDRNIEEIKEEIKDVLNGNIDYKYNSEEEIEKEIKEKSNLLIEVEKQIKDLENIIKTSFLGKRSIVAIEEDLENIVEQINVLEKRLKAINIAIENLEASGREVRESFGPTLNKKILNIFKKLTSEKYLDVKLGEDYNMTVRDKINIFPGEYLSNGANDQLYLALRIAFIELIFKNKKVPIIFDDSFIQYDDIRRERAMEVINDSNFAQTIIFSCQSIDQKIIKNKKIEANFINI